MQGRQPHLVNLGEIWAKVIKIWASQNLTSQKHLIFSSRLCLDRVKRIFNAN